MCDRHGASPCGSYIGRPMYISGTARGVEVHGATKLETQLLPPPLRRQLRTQSMAAA